MAEEITSGRVKNTNIVIEQSFMVPCSDGKSNWTSHTVRSRLVVLIFPSDENSI